MKTITTSFLTLLSYFGIVASVIWAVISFIIYLVKDISFDWRSMWCIGLSVALFILSAIFTVVFSVMEKDELKKKYDLEKKPIKSGFLQRLEEAQKKRDEERNKQ